MTRSATIYRSIAVLIITWRKDRKISQIQLAKMAGVKIDSVWRIESGRGAYLPTYAKIARVMGLTPGQLIDGKPEDLA